VAADLCGLEKIEPIHVALYIEELQQGFSKPRDIAFRRCEPNFALIYIKKGGSGRWPLLSWPASFSLSAVVLDAFHRFGLVFRASNSRNKGIPVGIKQPIGIRICMSSGRLSVPFKRGATNAQESARREFGRVSCGGGGSPDAVHGMPAQSASTLRRYRIARNRDFTTKGTISKATQFHVEGYVRPRVSVNSRLLGYGKSI
jgi:hypothetical protein